MPLHHLLVDIDRLPPDVRPEVLDLARKHNALVSEHELTQADVDGVTGTTPEEKAEMHGMFGVIRGGVNYLHKRRFNITMATFTLWMLQQLLQGLGLKTTTVTPILEKILSALMGTG